MKRRDTNKKLWEIVDALHWMARRYADGRRSYVTNMMNSITRDLLEMGWDPRPNDPNEPIWALDAQGRAFDHLSDDEAKEGRSNVT